MQRSLIHRLTQPTTTISVLLLVLGAIGILLSSPKWLVPVAPWLSPAFFLCYVQYTTLRRKWLWLFVAIVPASAVATLDVMPFPWFVLVFVVLLDGLKNIVLYGIHRWLTRNQQQFIWTLVFPSLWTVREFVETQGDIGTFASVANTQYSFSWLIQLASVTGIWGITFLLYWFAAVLVWAIGKYAARQPFARGLLVYGSTLAVVLSFGIYRYYSNETASAKTLTVGGVTVPNLHVLERLYTDATGKSVQIDPKASPASAVLQEANRGLIAFIEDPAPARFQLGYQAIQQQQDSLFSLSERAVARGANLVLWSEGSALLPKSGEPALIQRGQAFARRYRVYLLMAMGTILPGKLTSDRLFLENKTVLVDPGGRVINTFYKNHPVPMVERSLPGDGRVPAIQTPYGTIAPSICYDAEHIGTMRQLGWKNIGLLLLPSGDWYGIAPYHSYMAVFRAVENGCSLARQVSGGLSIFTDYRGNVLASNDFFSGNDRLTVVNMPVANVPTLYTRFGDWLAWLCVSLLVVFTGKALFDRINRDRTMHRHRTDKSLTDDELRTVSVPKQNL
ncbi:nitrilase-related carbon-nitrogen hydrolase [Spirosoma montaniterrae]|uniref:CN hydrolase domain-containing protein n=1 Tax=Spirosoma montaniterrae TaxID=1178516 RepID=A0A1P9X128_9BACT|nr:nitrilase-related carbon-nitrogen hydrolase [Spirosoma montaniterrae]AQG81324.1 hypothetical protein AWR27_19570 [Spirosoma montaniterrae]